MFKKMIFAAMFMLITGILDIKAQHAVMTAGGNISSDSDGSVSFSVGQVLYTTDKSLDGSVSQGVQQPYEISIYSGIQMTGVKLEISVYPNPVSSYLTLSVSELDLEKVQAYQLYDIEGRLISEHKVFETVTKIDMFNLTNGTYFLKIVDTQSIVKTFKIIKK